MVYKNRQIKSPPLSTAIILGNAMMDIMQIQPSKISDNNATFLFRGALGKIIADISMRKIHTQDGGISKTGNSQDVPQNIKAAAKKELMDEKEIKFYKSSNAFFKAKINQRIILMTTKASVSYVEFKFEKNDTILFGRESAGVPQKVHKLIKNKLKIPMENNKRSLNLASSVAIILAECLKQTKWIQTSRKIW